MYIEKNGYVIMEKEPMHFLVDDYNIEFDDDINIALVFDTKEEAKIWLEKQDNKEDFEILKYEKTIFISREYCDNENIIVKECEGSD